VESELDDVLGLVGKRPEEIRALDACGGSGNISLKLLRRNVPVTLADISPELLEIFRRKSQALGFKPEIVCKEIGTFLSEEERRFDLIVFSSALHHLQNIEEVLALAFERMAPGGVLFTIFDPTSRAELRRLTKILQRLEYYAFKVVHQSSDLPKAIGRRLRRMLLGVSARDKTGVALNAATAGMLAEFHVEQGINDRELVARLREIGYEVVRHDRYVDSRSEWVRRAIKTLGDVTQFKLVLRKPDSLSAKS
jgi:2-polyprenyl-3-methyl-5-hydroxy-6-metoxy-1,4-benzoquinol methylase